MDHSMFDDVVVMFKDTDAIQCNELKASCIAKLELPNIQKLRAKTDLSQSECALRLHISGRTLQN